MASPLRVANGARHPHAESGGAPSASAGGEDGKALQSPLHLPQSSPSLAESPVQSPLSPQSPALSQHSLLDWVALVLWMGWMHILLFLLLLIALTFPHPLALALLTLLATLSVTPVDPDGPMAKAYRRWLYPVVLRHFPMRIIFDDQGAITFGKPYVVAVEPHSVLPVGLAAFMRHPMCAQGVAGATSAIFRVPLLRQFWQWARLAPATRAVLSRVLQRGHPVIIVPGGVQECLFMAPGKEVAFVRSRFGFIRLALEQGVPVVPCFIFGQTAAYRWWKPGGAWYRAVARRMGFAPILFWGMWGSPIPLRTPLTVVVGKPIGQGHPDPHPSKERVAAVHAEYVSALERLFLDYRAQAGYPHMHLDIM
ncbi:hypothetical protein CLOM_g13215 [Closterium sp. NIES-68]|nr:hypothetical protein CLOM_g2421 [Closterium sp. NIES-68]GJP54106.1 hypothetical protein CLOM_g13215 [Closterium sp. NIES-68]GJP73247.1 hypothetical protein CLOP_g3991 [Closterium sp. NIES-67]GJP81448.1 hypothetical protein CLOP_g11597 [Closterium sp. NIES-67]